MRSIPLLLMTVCLGACKGPEPHCDPCDPHDLPPATEFEIVWVASYQSQERVLHDVGVSPQVGSTPTLIAGRDVGIRVGLRSETLPQFSEVTVLLQVRQGNQSAVNHVQMVDWEKPHADDLESTVNFFVPGEQITRGLSFEVSVRTTDPGDADARDDGGWLWESPTYTVLPAQTLDLVVLPIEVWDQQAYLPDVSDEAIERMRRALTWNFPYSDVRIRVDEPMDWNDTSFNEADWDELSAAVSDQRARSSLVEFGTYFYGVVNLADPGPYSGKGGVPVLPQDDSQRYGVGVDGAIGTMLHELGHNHGRWHVDCGNPGQHDMTYPHPLDSVGIQAWDIENDEVLAPTDAADVMSYCNPKWVSDHTFDAVYQRATDLAKLTRAAPVPMQLGYVGPDGTGRVGARTKSSGALGGEPTRVQLLDAEGTVLDVVDGWVYPTAHGTLRTVVFEDSGVDATRVALAPPAP